MSYVLKSVGGGREGERVSRGRVSVTGNVREAREGGKAAPSLPLPVTLKTSASEYIIAFFLLISQKNP